MKTVKLSVLMDVEDDFLPELRNTVDHHMEKLLNLEDYEYEIKRIHGAKVGFLCENDDELLEKMNANADKIHLEVNKG